MVCTDAAARGLDVPDITHVVQVCIGGLFRGLFGGWGVGSSRFVVRLHAGCSAGPRSLPTSRPSVPTQSLPAPSPPLPLAPLLKPGRLCALGRRLFAPRRPHRARRQGGPRHLALQPRGRAAGAGHPAEHRCGCVRGRGWACDEAQLRGVGTSVGPLWNLFPLARPGPIPLPCRSPACPPAAQGARWRGPSAASAPSARSCASTESMCRGGLRAPLRRGRSARRSWRTGGSSGAAAGGSSLAVASACSCPSSDLQATPRDVRTECMCKARRAKQGAGAPAARRRAAAAPADQAPLPHPTAFYGAGWAR